MRLVDNPTGQVQDQAPQRPPLVIAHRGASAIAPENTLRSFKLAVLLGADGIELDVHLSADGQPVVIHDRRLDRTTNASGPVSRLTASQLGKLDAASWFERRLVLRPRVRARVVHSLESVGALAAEPDDEHVPTLEDVLSVLDGAGLRRVYIELKGVPETRALLLDRTLALIRAFDLKSSATILSFHHDVIRWSSELAPDVRRAINIPAPVKGLLRARSILKAAGMARASEVALHFSLASKRLVRLLHDHGLEVSVWTVNGRMIMRRMVTTEVNSIITNFTDRLRGILQASLPGGVHRPPRIGRLGRISRSADAGRP
jgi:glycerophosphoryl diester phosphodiesterase